MPRAQIVRRPHSNKLSSRSCSFVCDPLGGGLEVIFGKTSRGNVIIAKEIGLPAPEINGTLEKTFSTFVDKPISLGKCHRQLKKNLLLTFARLNGRNFWRYFMKGCVIRT
jgi:hypothetical protein